MLYVCSLSRLSETADKTGATWLVSLINADMNVRRPTRVAPENHLFLGFNDIVDVVEGLTPPAETHVLKLLDFVRGWDRSEPLLIHCWAGVSRSTAGAYITACALNPDRNEYDVAATLRAQSPSATPNARLVTMADKLLGRDGRMVDAVRKIGRGANTFEGAPFLMPID